MAVKPIVLYSVDPDALRRPSRRVKRVDRRIEALIEDLKDTLLASDDGIGLAAPQINVHSRVVIVRLGGRRAEGQEPGPPIALVNARIVEARDLQRDFDGCLSFPGLYGETVRPHWIKVRGLDEQGAPLERVFTGFDAVVVHHELDHLDGVLFIDHVVNPGDLYRVYRDEEGLLHRLPLSAEALQLLRLWGQR